MTGYAVDELIVKTPQIKTMNPIAEESLLSKDFTTKFVVLKQARARVGYR